MTTKRIAIASFVSIAAIAFAVASFRGGTARAAEGKTPTQFEGKILLIYGNKPEQGGTIVNARVEQLGSTDFLVGNYIDEPEYQWKRNLAVYIKLDQINAIVVYNNMDEYKRNKGVPTVSQK